MRAYELAAVFVVVSSSTTARSAQTTPPVDVTVCVTGDGIVPGFLEKRAMATVTWMYARIGVRIAWLHDDPRSTGTFASPVVIHVRFAGQPTGNHSRAALAYASPFAEGVKVISVMYDRIHLVGSRSSREQQILAHVLAHEIGHVLQATTDHAWTGVMKATWNSLDFDAMQSKPLEFTPADVVQIKQGLIWLKTRAGSPAGSTPEL